MSTWSDFFTIVCIATAFFAAGLLWEHEAQMRREEQRAARRRAHRIHIKQKEGN
jgi:hypothetical protein